MDQVRELTIETGMYFEPMAQRTFQRGMTGNEYCDTWISSHGTTLNLQKEKKKSDTFIIIQDYHRLFGQVGKLVHQVDHESGHGALAERGGCRRSAQSAPA